MRPNIFLISALRRPLRTLGLMLLCAAVSFALLTQLLQASVLARAVDEISGYYRAVGSFSPLSGDPDEFDCTACVAAVADDPRVKFVDVRRRATYTMAEHETAELTDPSWNPAVSMYYVRGVCGAPSITEGDYDALYFMRLSAEGNYCEPELSNVSRRYRLAVTIGPYELLAGYAGRYFEGRTLTAYYYSDDPEELARIAGGLQSGQEMLFKLYNTSIFANSQFWLQPLDGRDCWAYPIPAGGQIDYADARLAGVREDMSLLDVNLRSAQLTTTRDMGAIADLEEKYALLDGRLLNLGDYESANPVCVIRQELALSAGLAVGDTLRVTLWDLDAPGSAVRPDLEGKTLSALPNREVRLTVVGILLHLNDGSYELSERYGDIFLPDSVLPQGWGSTAWEGRCASPLTSVVLSSMQDTQAFLADYEETFRTLGWSFRFAPNGWTDFAAAAEPLRQSARSTALLFALAAALALGSAAFLHLLFTRREAAILRALGFPARRVLRAALRPLLMIDFSGILLGGAAASVHGMQKAAASLQGIAGGTALSIVYPWGTMLAGCGALALGLLLLAYSVLRRQVSLPVLAQLQGAAGTVRTRKSAPQPRPAVSAPTSTVSICTDSAPQDLLLTSSTVRGTISRQWTLSFVCKRLRRQVSKTALSALLTAALLLGLCCLSLSVRRGEARIDALYDSLTVTGEILRTDTSYRAGGGFLPSAAANTLEALGYFSEVHKVIGGEVTAVIDGGVPAAQAVRKPNGAKASAVPEPTQREIISADALFCACFSSEDCIELQTGDLTVTWVDGWEESSFFAADHPAAIVARSLLRELSWQVGDELVLAFPNTAFSVTIAGSFFDEEDAPYRLLLSAAPLTAALDGMGQPYAYASYSFTIDRAQNRALPAFRAAAESLLQDAPSDSSLFLLLRDSELTQAVEPLERNVTLLRVLRPAMLVLAALLTAGVSALLTAQSVSELALLRVMGICARHTSRIAVWNQLLPVLIGLLVGGCTMLTLGLASIALVSGGLLLTLGGTAGGLITARTYLRKNPLELLQVKE